MVSCRKKVIKVSPYYRQLRAPTTIDEQSNNYRTSKRRKQLNTITTSRLSNLENNQTQEYSTISSTDVHRETSSLHTRICDSTQATSSHCSYSSYIPCSVFSLMRRNSMAFVMVLSVVLASVSTTLGQRSSAMSRISNDGYVDVPCCSHKFIKKGKFVVL